MHGMSNGGAFAATSAHALKVAGYPVLAASVHCADALDTVFALTTVPTQFCMAQQDNNDQVSNANAFDNHQKLVQRGICTNYYLHPPTPLPAERLLRVGLSQSQAQATHADLVNNNWLDANLVPRLLLDAALQATITPSAFPGLTALSATAQLRAADQYDVCYAAHKYYADYTARILRFFADPCGTTTGLDNNNNNNASVNTAALRLWPQPATPGTQVWVDGLAAPTPYHLVSGITGAQVAHGVLAPGQPLTLPTGLAAGLYVLQTPTGALRLLVQ